MNTWRIDAHWATNSVVLLYASQPQLVLQSWHDLTRMMGREPSDLDSSQPPGAAPALYRRIVDLQMLLDRTRDQLTHLRCGQRGGPDFSPAASPDSGTTRP